MNPIISGSYTPIIGLSSSSWRALLQVLQNQQWIDSQTRAISLELTTYNPNVNLFNQIKMTVEMPASGGIFPYSR